MNKIFWLPWKLQTLSCTALTIVIGDTTLLYEKMKSGGLQLNFIVLVISNMQKITEFWVLRPAISYEFQVWQLYSKLS